VFTENSSGSLPLEVAKQYLLFAVELDGRLAIANCGKAADIGQTVLCCENHSMVQNESKRHRQAMLVRS
jgi:hypothetical protein